jgi:hypothetical protein
MKTRDAVLSGVAVLFGMALMAGPAYLSVAMAADKPEDKA